MKDGRFETVLQTGQETPAGGGRLFGGRYRALRLLKKGQEVETLLGTDLALGDPVVIKTASAASLAPGAQMRLEHEISVLRQIHHPSIAPLLDLGREEDLLYLVMPFIPG